MRGRIAQNKYNSISTSVENLKGGPIISVISCKSIEVNTDELDLNNEIKNQNKRTINFQLN